MGEMRKAAIAPRGAATLDPVVREVVRGALLSMQAEMEALIERTAMSPFIREKKDYFIGVFDAAGQLILGTNIPVFGDIIRPVMEAFPPDTMRPGDIYWYNDPYSSAGGVSHTPDQVFIAPIFIAGQLAAFVQSWAHFSDVGGMRPGSLSPDATDIFQEGTLVPPVRLYREGVMNEDAFRIFKRNSRFPDMVLGDTRASIAAVRLGEKRITEIFERFGIAAVHAVFASLIEETRALVARKLEETFPEGTYSFTDYVDHDGHGNGPFAIRFDLRAGKDGVSLDATRTDDQSPGAINYLMHPDVPKMIFGIYFISQEPGALLNQGAAHAFGDVKLRPGSLLNPRAPAALGQRGVTLVRVISACSGLLGVATKGNSVAAGNVYALYYMRGIADDGQGFLLTDGVAVGCGARPFADGIDAVYFVAQENYPAEFMDSTFPVRLRRYELNCDSGGPGRWRGGCGVIREIEVLADNVMLSNRIDAIVHPPWGLNGGRNGGSGRCVVNPGRANERVLPSIADGTILRRGDVFRIETGGGGGWGNPFDRPAERVREDVLGGFVSVESAERDYGVVLRAVREIDRAATERLRGERPRAKLFHRREYVDGFQ